MKLVTRLYRRVAHRGDERGAIMVLSVVGFVVMIVASALSVDIGRVALEKRKDQAVADLAALDAARDRNNAATLASDGAKRNGFDPTAPGHNISVVVGSLDSSGAFVPNVGSTAVKVTVSSVVNYLFQAGSHSVSASAVAAMQDKAGFWIGSSLGSISTDQAALLNQTIGPMIGTVGGGALSITAVGWQGLLTASVTLQALSNQLVTSGLDVGTVDKLMSADITVAQLYNATATVLTNQGQLAQANVLSALATAAGSGSAHLKLGDLFSFNQGDPGTVMSTSINLLPYVTGTAEIANGSNLITIPSATVAVPNVTATAVSLQIIEKPRFYFGTVSNPGPSVTTGQVHLTVTPTLNLPITVPGLVTPKITGALPVDITSAGADGTLEAVACTNPQSITVGVDPKPVAETASGGLQVTALGLPLPVAVTVNASATVTGSHGDLNFAYPSEFSPPAPSKHSGSTTIGLGSLANSTNVTVGSGLVTVPVVVNALNPALSNLDSLVVQPLAQALGLEIGSADVAALSRECNVLGLAH